MDESVLDVDFEQPPDSKPEEEEENEEKKKEPVPMDAPTKANLKIK